MASHNKGAYHLTLSKLLVGEVMIWLNAYEVTNPPHVDKTAGEFNQSKNQR